MTRRPGARASSRHDLRTPSTTSSATASCCSRSSRTATRPAWPRARRIHGDGRQLADPAQRGARPGASRAAGDLDRPRRGALEPPLGRDSRGRRGACAGRRRTAGRGRLPRTRRRCDRVRACATERARRAPGPTAVSRAAQSAAARRGRRRDRATGPGSASVAHADPGRRRQRGQPRHAGPPAGAPGLSTVLTADGGRAGARHAAAAAPVDLVLLDIMMPELDGYEVLDSCKRRSRAAGHPGHHDLGARRDRQRGPLHRDGRRGLPAASRSTRCCCGPGSAPAWRRSACTTRSAHCHVDRRELAEWNQTLERRVARAGRAARAAGPAQALLLAAARRADRGRRRRRSAQDATAARSRSCSSTCAASPPSPRRPSRRRSWACSGSTTRRWAS